MKNHHKSCRKLTRWWALASIAWIAFILWSAEAYYPSVPLDIDGHDPGTLAAFASAVRHYYLRHHRLGARRAGTGLRARLPILPVARRTVGDRHRSRAPRWRPKPYCADAPCREDRRSRRHPFIRGGTETRRASRDLYSANVRQAGFHFCRRPLEALDTFNRNRRTSRGRDRHTHPARHRGR